MPFGHYFGLWGGADGAAVMALAILIGNILDDYLLIFVKLAQTKVCHFWQ